MASGALWLQFSSLILHLYQTPGGKQAENQRDVSTRVITTHPACLFLCLTLIRNKQDKRHQQAFMSHHTSAVHMSVSSHQCSSTKEFFKDSPHQLGFKELHIRDPLCIRSVPLNTAALMCHILAPFSALIHALLPCPMEVIRRVPFLPDHKANKRLLLQMSCHIGNSLCGSAGDARNLLCSSNQNKAE